MFAAKSPPIKDHWRAFTNPKVTTMFSSSLIDIEFIKTHMKREDGRYVNLQLYTYFTYTKAIMLKCRYLVNLAISPANFCILIIHEKLWFEQCSAGFESFVFEKKILLDLGLCM